MVLSFGSNYCGGILISEVGGKSPQEGGTGNVAINFRGGNEIPYQNFSPVALFTYFLHIFACGTKTVQLRYINRGADKNFLKY